MPLTQLPPLDPSSPTFRADVDTFFRSRMQTFVSEANALVANLNSIAAGGAYAIPYKLGFSGTVGSGAGGIFELNDGLTLRVDTKDSAGKPVGPILATFAGSGSVVKGTVRIVAQGDPSRWLIYNVLAYAQDVSGNYGSITAGFVTGSAGNGNPLLPGEGVLLFFQRTGDKGDTGPAGNTAQPVIYVRDEKSIGTGGGLFNSTVYTRVLNTTKVNTIPGASLANNRVTVPAGRYNIFGRAPAYNVGAHRLGLWNVSADGLTEIGMSIYSGASGSEVIGGVATVELRDFVLYGAATTFELRHYLQNLGGTDAQGRPSSLALSNEVYAELIFQKIG